MQNNNRDYLIFTPSDNFWGNLLWLTVAMELIAFYFDWVNCQALTFNPTIGRGALNSRPEEKLRFWHLFLIQLTQKIWLFPNIYGNASCTLLEALISLNKGFYSIFLSTIPKFESWNVFFWLFLGLKWLKLVYRIQNKLYQWLSTIFGNDLFWLQDILPKMTFFDFR